MKITGTATGSPAKGTTRTGGVTNVNWKNIDDSTTAYTAAAAAEEANFLVRVSQF